MIKGIDHVVLLAAELEPAIRGFEQVGFSVVRGGIHPVWGTENALISLADGFYLELLAPRPHSTDICHRLWLNQDGRLRKPGEYGGYALEADNLRADVRAAAAHGLEFETLAQGTRHRTDGTEVKWLLTNSVRPDFPFLIEDLTPRYVRVPPAIGPLNTRTRLAAVTVAVADALEASQAYAALLNRPANTVGSRNSLPTTRGRIELTDLRHVAGERPVPGLFAVSLVVAGEAPRVLPDMTGGALLSLVADDCSS